jgi:hypothetical protein
MGMLDLFILSFLVLFGLPLSLMAGALVTRLTGNRALGRAVPLAFLALLVFGIPLALHRAGIDVPARVVDRIESVRVHSDGDWSHHYSLTVRYAAENAELADETSRQFGTDSLTVTVLATRELYDRTAPGMLLDIRYVSWRPSLAKPSELSYLALALEYFGDSSVRIALALVSLFGLLAALTSWRPKHERLRGPRHAWIAACCVGLIGVVLWTSVLSPLFAPPLELEPTAVAEARVVSVVAITSKGKDEAYRVLSHPFDVVEVEYVPAGWSQPVRGVDAVDATSVSGLVSGERVRVRYASETPRRVYIEGAARGHVRGNAADEGRTWLLWLGLAGVVAVITGLGYRRRRDPATARRGPRGALDDPG